MSKVLQYPDVNHPNVIRWEVDHGVETVILKKAPPRVQPPEVGDIGYESWADLDEKIGFFEEGLLTKKKQPVPSTSAGQQKRLLEIQEMEADIETYYDDRQRLTEWEDEQIRRCLHGYGHMTGKHYFYYNFGWIQEVSKTGSIRNIQPTYRQSDDWIIRAISQAEEQNRGIMAVKRRRFGMTWVACMDIVYDLLFKDSTIQYMTYSEDDQEKFFLRVKFMLSRLPVFLQRQFNRNAIDLITLHPSARIAKIRGIPVEDVPESTLKTGSTKEEKNAAGSTLGKLVLDEIGEIQNIRDILQWGVPALAGSNGLDRAGCLVMFGTVGSMEKAGPVVKWLWQNPEVNEVNPLFIDGTRGTYMDDAGNDLREKAKKRIKERLTVLEESGAYDELARHRQKYPLTIEDAFMYITTDKVWPADVIQIAQDQYDAQKFVGDRMFGRFWKDEAGRVRFKREEMRPSGDQERKNWVGYNQWMIWEAPKKSLFEEPYAAGCDPVDMDTDLESNKRVRRSDITCSIYKRAQNSGEMSDFWVAEYCGRPNAIEEAYEQIFLACVYYDCKVNIERQKGHRMIGYGHAHGYSEYMVMGAGVAMGLDAKERTEGFTSTQRWWNTMVSLGRKWWLANYQKPVSARFIEESLFVREKNTDLTVAHLAALQWSSELDLREDMGKERFKDQNSRNTLESRTAWRQLAGGRHYNIAQHSLSARMRKEQLRRKQTYGY